MERLNALAEELKHVAGLLAEDVLEPDPARTDWTGMKVRVDMVRTGMDKVLEGLSGALEEADEAELKTLVRKRVADMAARTAGLLIAAGSSEGARRLLEKAIRITEDASQRAELEAGLAEPELFCRYGHAVWLLGHGRFGPADALLKRVGKESRQKALKEAAQKAMRGSRPLTGAPALFRINGCGVGLYGKRDEAPDGTYVATYFISLLFIPVFPLTAYRVREVEGNAYQFFARESLGPVTRAWQRLVLAGVAGVLLWSGVTNYLQSPERLARLALEEAQAAEATLSREDALERYRSVIDSHFEDSARASAADAMVRLSLAGLPTPCTRDAVEAAGRVVAGIASLPAGSYRDAPTIRLGERLDGCAREIGQQTEADTRAALAVVESALRVATHHPALKKRQVELERALADRLVKEQPLQALALYVELPGKEALDAAQALIDTFGEAPSLWLEASSSVEKWMGHEAQDSSRSDKVALYRSRLAAARTAHANDEALIAEGDETKIVKALKASPGNQELSVAAASLARGRGDARGARDTLKALGPEGRLTGEARMMLAICHRDLGQLAEADAVLSSFVAERLAPFQRVQRQYEEEAHAVQERLISQARAGQLPKEVENRLKQLSGEEEQRKILREWLSDRMESDPGLEKLRGEYLRQEAVVPAALMLGMVKLQRANDAEGEARRVLLGEAERVFLSIRQEAEDNPRFHLGLGQVYHRLGRTEEGDKELRGVVERKDPELMLEVAKVYRELDRLDQARPLGEEVYATATDESYKHSAAALLSRMATDEDEEEKWLRKSDLSSPDTQNELLEVEAHRALREGRLEDADRALARSVAYRAREAKHNAVAANNTAMTLMARYQATADLTHLRSAVRYLEDAVRLAPDNALVVGNLANAQEFLGNLTVLERWVRTRPLHLRSEDAEELLGVLLKGPLREEVLRAMDADPALRRSQELSQQEQTLAPGRTSAWERQAQWLRRHRDERGLAALAKRLETLPPFEGGGTALARRKWESGEMDAQLGKWTAQYATRAEASLKRAKQTNHAPTIAAAWHLLGEALVRMDYFEQKPEQLDTMVDAYRQAAKLWPPLGASGDLEQVLTIAALERGVAKSEALAKVWKEERRIQSTAMLMHHALTGPSGAEVAAVLRTQPELKEAAEHARERVKGTPEVADWVLAKAAGDVVLEQAAAAVFSRPEVELGLAIDMRLAGGHPREKAEQELFQRGKAQKGHP